MSLLVKICGICRPEDAEAVGAMRPDAMGFIFYPPSPRYVEPGTAQALVDLVPEGILKVGVFVNMPPAEVAAVRETVGLNVVQLHGKEDPEAYRDVGAPLWKVVHLDRWAGEGEHVMGSSGRGEGRGASRSEARPPSGRGPVDALLIDSYTSEAPGGTGVTADWDQARRFVETSPMPVLLAGGLTPDNVKTAVHEVAPWGVDVSSGVEAWPGRKDLEAVRTFVERCRSL